MVNVTKSNFLTQLSDFLTHLPTSSYIAIDEEMTGISLPTTNGYQRPNKLELPRVKYLRSLKGVPERYSILQVGVALFHKNPKYNIKPTTTTTMHNVSGSVGGVGIGGQRENNDNVDNDEAEDNEHAYMHREGMLTQDELENVTEVEEHTAASADANAGNADDDNINTQDDTTAAAAEQHQPQQPEYISRTYNFYLFPNGGKKNWNGSNHHERELTLNPSTVKFLLEHHMDFDKVFREGVPYTTVENASQMKKMFFKKYAAMKDSSSNNGEKGTNTPVGKKIGDATTPSSATTPRKDRVKLSRVEDIAFVARTMAELREWIDSDDSLMADNNGAAVAVGEQQPEAIPNNGGGQKGEGTSLVLPPCNAFLRRCLYETIQDEYPGLILERADIDPANAEAAATLRNQIRVIRLSPAEKLRREARMKQEAWDELLMDMGFTIIFQAISDACNGNVFSATQTRQFLDGMCPELSTPTTNGVESDSTSSMSAGGRKIPLITHNGLHDLLFLLTHCHNPTLPESFEDTKQIIRSYFPLVFDTKVIGTEYSDATIKGGSTTLGDLFDTICKDDIVPFHVTTIVNQDGRNQGQAHEAAWDAYMTGCIFSALCNRILKSKNRSGSDYDNLDNLLQNSSRGTRLREWFGLNLLYMHFSLYTIDLESKLGPDGLDDPLSGGLSYDSTFHVSGITATVSTRDILQALTAEIESEYDVIRQLKYEIIWVDDSSFFVGTRMGDYVAATELPIPELIASHVRNKLHGGLGKLDIVSLGEHLRKTSNEIETTESGGIVGSIATIASKPFQVIGKLFGLPDKTSTDDKHSRKRMRLN